MNSAERHRADTADLVARLVGVARRQLGMEMAWMSLVRDGEQVVEVVDRPDDSAYTLEPGDRAPLSESSCTRLVRGDSPDPVDGTSEDEIARVVAATDDLPIGSFIGTSITDDGRMLGMICCVDPGSSPRLGDDAVRVLGIIAGLVSEVILAESPAFRREREVRRRVLLALAERRFHSRFQPIVSLDNGRVVGVEALTRFDEEPERPDRWFIDAHAVGLGVELELAAVSSALDQLPDLPDGAYLSVNASPAALCDPRLAWIISRSEPTRIVVEITEHEAIDDYAQIVSSLQTLRGMGVRIAVDDVGAGFSSFAHVLELSPHVLKLDISITRGLDADPARRALAIAIVEVARRIGAVVVAEGIETSDELAAAVSVGISGVQGFLLGRPQVLPLAESDVDLPVVEGAIAPEAAGLDGGLTSAQFELAMLHSPIGICLVALDGTFLRVNSALAAMLGYSRTELVDLRFQELTHPDDLDVDLRLLLQCLDGSRTSYRIEKRYLHADGSVVWGDLSVVLARDGDGTPRYFVSQIVDVTEQRAREEDLAARVLTDHMTGVHNRSAAERAMQRLDDDGRTFGVLFCDVRGFKQVNDSHGHAVGDSMLRTLAARISANVRSVDLVARWGGDEFVIVQPDVDPESLPATAVRIVQECSRPVDVDGHARIDGVQVTIGTAVHDGSGSVSVAETVHQADVDMYSRRAVDPAAPRGERDALRIDR